MRAMRTSASLKHQIDGLVRSELAELKKFVDRTRTVSLSRHSAGEGVMLSGVFIWQTKWAGPSLGLC